MAPSAEELRALYREQDAWFSAGRSRLLREAGIASRRRVLDLGCGTGETYEELSRRAGGPVVCVDRDPASLGLARGPRAAARASRLPFADGAFDLVFAQMFFLWAKPLDAALSEIVRVLEPGGALVAAAEPDYGGLVEHPSGSSGLREAAAALVGEGADPEIGRKLGRAMKDAGLLRVECGTHPGRPLEAPRLGGLARPRAEAAFLHLPYFWFIGHKRAA